MCSFFVAAERCSARADLSSQPGRLALPQLPLALQFGIHVLDPLPGELR